MERIHRRNMQIWGLNALAHELFEVKDTAFLTAIKCRLLLLRPPRPRREPRCCVELGGSRNMQIWG